ncbi:MAG TPA: DUF2188 domain-containing protein [Nannocystaceae bacterium]|nr:DUF2188 domain-containing protein [Nannocystaceae bacterium]
MQTRFHVMPTRGHRWAVVREGAKRASVLVLSKTEAVERARILASKVDLAQVIVHGPDGRVQSEFTCALEPMLPRP